MENAASKADRPIKINVNEESSFLNTVFEGAPTHPYHNLLLFAGEVWAACRLNAWCLNAKNGTLLNSFSKYEKDLSRFFIVGKCLDYVVEHTPYRYPFLLSDALGMVWIAEYSPIAENEEDTTLLFVFGPIFTSTVSPLTIAENLDRMNLSFTIRRQLETVLNEVPILMNSSIEQYARMLHFALTGEPCGSRDFQLQKARVEIDLFSEGKALSYEELTGTKIPLERAVEYESRLLNMVREGRLDDKLLSRLRAQSDVSHYVDGNPIRSAKDELIILCTKYMMTAEEAGLPLRVCRTLSLRYTKQIEQGSSLTELTALARSMTEDFVVRVQECNAAPEKSREVMIAEDYIRANLTARLSIEEVARYVGYSDYYLSRKFAKETGMKFADYVNRERIRYAQTLLKTSNMPIQAIADTLQFSGLSYFGRVFKKLTGQTPKEYREGK